MATRFTDAEDKELVQAAINYEAAGRRIRWPEVARRLRRIRREPNELRRRLDALKRTYGLRLADFPPSFFGRPVRRLPRQASRQQPQIVQAPPPSPPPQARADKDDDVGFSLGSHALDLDDLEDYDIRDITVPVFDLSTELPDSSPVRRQTEDVDELPGGLQRDSRALTSLEAMNEVERELLSGPERDACAITALETPDELPSGPQPEVHALTELKAMDEMERELKSASSAIVTAEAIMELGGGQRAIRTAEAIVELAVVTPTDPPATNPEDAICKLSGELLTAAPVVDTAEAIVEFSEDSMCLMPGMPTGEGNSEETSMMSAVAQTPRADDNGDELIDAVTFEILALDRVVRALGVLFGRVTAADVRAPLHSPHFNVGEVLAPSIASMFDTIGGMDNSDTFLDVGSGLGNVLVQAALQTGASRCIGIEVRESVYEISRDNIAEHIQTYPQLRRVRVMNNDVRDLTISAQLPFAKATVVYTNNVVFQSDVNTHLQGELRLMRRARAVITTLSFCPRHRAQCRAEFCTRWRLHTTLQGEGSWTAHEVPLFVYLRR